MVHILNFRFREVFPLFLVLLFFAASALLCVAAKSESQSGELFRRGRRILDSQDPPKKSADALSTKSQNKLIKTNQFSKNQTKLIHTSLSTKNTTKLGKPTNSTKPTSGILPKIALKKLNSTSSKLPKLNSTSKPSNSTKSNPLSTKKSSDLLKLSVAKNKTTSPNSTKPFNQKKGNEDKAKKKAHPQQPSWVDEEGEEDLVSEFRDLPSRFQQTLIPDLAKISTTSKAYITHANKQITQGFKPIVGNKYASTVASMISFAFILIPLILVSLLVNRIKAYFSLQKLLIFIQIYLSIYFCILCLSSLATGLEPLKFFYSTSQSTYICLQVMQTLGYILYLLLLVMYLVLVFSTECGLGSRMLGLAQTFVGYAVGLHYHVAVFHRMVLHQPPKTNWKIHGIYAACFLVICLFAGAERRKKAYLEEGGAEGKKS